MILCLWISEFYFPTNGRWLQFANMLVIRYEIEDDETVWKDAEKQVLKAAKSGKSGTTVSVKTKTKRKAVEDGGEEKGHSKAKKPKKEKSSKR